LGQLSISSNGAAPVPSAVLASQPPAVSQPETGAIIMVWFGVSTGA